MPNYQEMKLKNKKHYESSMDKSLRPPKREDGYKVGPWVLGIFLFVIVGSVIFQILSTTKGNMSEDILA